MNNFPPTVTVLDSTVELGLEISMLGRFSVSDIDPDPEFTMFRFRDSNTAPQSGYFMYQGDVWQQGLVLEVSAANLADVTYHAGAIISSELVTIEAFDGLFWSAPGLGTFFSVTPNVNVPIVSGSDLVVTALESIAVDGFISASDPDGYPILEYMFIDGIADPFGGYFSLFGAQMPSVTWFSVLPEELPFLRYHGAQYGTSEPIAVLARDEAAYSALNFFDAITNPNNFDPTVVANDISVVFGESIGLQEMFTFADLDGNTLKVVEVVDLGVSPTSGYFEFDGFPVTGGQPFSVYGSDLHRVNYVAGSLFGSEQFQVQVWDGQRLSTIATALATTNELPVVEVVDILMVDSFEFVRLADVLDVTTSISPIFYEFIDLNDAPTSGRLSVNGSDLAAGEIHVVSSSDFAQTFLRGGADDLGRSFDEYIVRVDNGFSKSAWTKINVSTDPVNEEAVLGLGFWNFQGPQLQLTYNFPAMVPQYYCTDNLDECTNNMVLTDPDMRQAIRSTLVGISNFIDVTFTEISATELSDIPFMWTNDGDMGLLGYSYGPGNKDIFDVRGDIWGNSNSPPLYDSQPGGTGYATWIHEMGHSLGLEHSFEGTAILPAAMEDNRFSIMSYDRNFPMEPITLQLYDVMALQTLYGPNPTYRAGNTQIKIDPNSPIPQTVFDSGGFDSLNFNNHVVGVTVDLREGQFSSVGNEIDNVAIAWGTKIENARGGSGVDNLKGNEMNNILIGNLGNDRLEGRDGQDVLSGNQGNDTYVWAIGDGFDVINEDFGAGRDEIHVELFDEYDSGNDTLTEIFSFRKFGNDLRIDLAFDGEASHGGMRITNMGWGKNRVETLRLFDFAGEQIGPAISLQSVFAGATVTSQQFVLTENTSNYGNLAVPLV